MSTLVAILIVFGSIFLGIVGGIMIAADVIGRRAAIGTIQMVHEPGEEKPQFIFSVPKIQDVKPGIRIVKVIEIHYDDAQ